MNVNALLSEAAPTNMNNRTYEYSATSTPYHNNGSIMTPQSLSPSTECKNVHFRFCNSEPKTLHIYPHDTTDSITTTVKNMFGIKLQDECGLSFQDPEGKYMILRHENFSDDMMVDIRVEENPASYPQYNLRHPQAMSYTGPGPRGSFSGGRSVSPSAARGRRSASAGGRPRGMKRQASHRGEEEHYDERFPQGYYLQQPPQQFLPEEDEESESRSRIEPVASADISLDNIVEGSRRKRPKFSSDELPLFPPPALPRQDGSTSSSASPSHPAPQVTTPYGNRNIIYPHPTPPSTYGFSVSNGGQPASAFGQARTNGSTIPTPAPTVASCISDEDVALQLMRLGELPSGSATISTLDETAREEDSFSSECGEFGDDGRSDTAELPDMPPRGPDEGPGSPIIYPRNHKKYKSLDEILPSFDSTPLPLPAPLPQYPKGTVKAVKRQQPTQSSKPKSKPKPRSEHHWPISPASPPASRKPSVASVASSKARSNIMTSNNPVANVHTPMVLLGQQTATPVDENKLHTQYFHNDNNNKLGVEEPIVKPRCQRCRKSKKGCDRQRPCQRCKDAGIPAGECISEDEAGTRRGRQAAAAAAKKAAGGGLAGLNKNKAKGKRKRV
ncbi:hypothetical protein HOY82DRAFT_580965 [Tuber indicum]|nr:hypothetical protein HOY82DRAFT_580965 [Tuber indicum]